MYKLLSKRFYSKSHQAIDPFFIKSGLYVPGNQVNPITSYKIDRKKCLPNVLPQKLLF
jgi:hypothetical protein